MPQFTVTAPDGSTFDVEAPEGATEEQAIAYVRKQHEFTPIDDAGSEPDNRGEFNKGVASGTKNMEGMAYGAIGLIGDSLNNEAMRDFGLEGYTRKQKEAEVDAPKVGSYTEIEDFGSFLDYTAGVLGQTAPFSATTIVSGGMGGLLAKAVAPRMLAKGISEAVTKAAIKRMLADPVKKKALGKIVNRSMLAGSAGASSIVQQGGLYGELKEAGVEDAVMPAWIGGAVMGGLDVAPEAFLFSKVFGKAKVGGELNKAIARGIGPAAKRIAKGTAQQTALEGATEGMQEVTALIARASSDPAFDWNSDESHQRVLDSIVAGGVAGLFMGAGGNAIGELVGKKEATSGKAGGGRPVDGNTGVGGAGAGAAAASLAGGGVAPGAAAAQPLDRTGNGAVAVDGSAASVGGAVPATAPVGGDVRPAVPATPQAAPQVAPQAATEPVSGATAGQAPQAQRDELSAIPQTLTALRQPPPSAPATEAPAASQAASAPTAEPIGDIRNQLRDVRNPRNSRRAVFLSADNLAVHGTKITEQARGLVAVENADGKGGTLFAKLEDARAYRQRRAAGEDPEALIGEFTGADPLGLGGKPDTATPVVIQQKTPDGAVTRETVADGANAAQVQAAATALEAPGREVTASTVPQALARRDQGTATPAAGPDTVTIAPSPESARVVTTLARRFEAAPTAPLSTLVLALRAGFFEPTSADDVALNSERLRADMAHALDDKKNHYSAHNQKFNGEEYVSLGAFPEDVGTSGLADGAARILPPQFEAVVVRRQSDNISNVIMPRRVAEAIASGSVKLASQATPPVVVPTGAVNPAAAFTTMTPLNLGKWLRFNGGPLIDQSNDAAPAVANRLEFFTWLNEKASAAHKSAYRRWREDLDSYDEMDTDLGRSLPPADAVLGRQVLLEIPSAYRAAAKAWMSKAGNLTKLRAKTSWPFARKVREVLNASTGKDAAQVYTTAKANEAKRNKRAKAVGDAQIAAAEAAEAGYAEGAALPVNSIGEEEALGAQLTGWEDNIPAMFIGSGGNSADGVVHGQRTFMRPRTDERTGVRTRGHTKRVTAQAWVGPDAEQKALQAAASRQVEDGDATYLAQELSDGEAFGFGLPGGGWYVLAYPHISSETYNSKSQGGKRTAASLTRGTIANGINRYNGLSQEQKNPQSDTPVYGVHFTVTKSGEAADPVTILSEEIVDLGLTLQPQLRTDTDTNLKHRLEQAFRVGLAAIIDSEVKGRRMSVTGLAPGARGLSGMTILRQGGRRGPQILLKDAVGGGQNARALMRSGVYTTSTARGRTKFDMQLRKENRARVGAEEDLATLNLDLKNTEANLEKVELEIDTLESKPRLGVRQQARLDTLLEQQEELQEEQAGIIQDIESAQEEEVGGERIIDDAGPAFDKGSTASQTMIFNEDEEQFVPYALGEDGQIEQTSMESGPDTRQFEDVSVQNRRSVSDIESQDQVGGSDKRKGSSAIGVVGANRPSTNNPARDQAVYVSLLDEQLATTVDNIVTTLRNMLKIKKSMVVVDNLAAALRVARERGWDAAKVQRAIEAREKRGAVGTVVRIGDETLIIMDSNQAGSAQWFKTLAHEVGHVFFRQAYDEASLSVRTGLDKAYEEWTAKHADVMQRAAATGQVYNIHEWMADQTAIWVYSNATPRTALEKFFHGLATQLAKVFEFMRAKGYTADETAQAFIRSAVGGPRTPIAAAVSVAAPQPATTADRANTLRGYTNQSGGAQGADTAWTEIGAEYGATSNNYSFKGHAGGTRVGRVELNQAQLATADQHLKKANRTLKRAFPAKNEYVNNLLRRNWFQVENADAVFAISSWHPDGNVNGGTGWAVQMAVDNGKTAYVFDQDEGKWYEYSEVGVMELPSAPALTPRFAGIGSRALNDKGRAAIRAAYEATVAANSSGALRWTMDTSFESLGDGNDLAFDMNIAPNEPQSWARQLWTAVRALRAKYPTVDKFAEVMGGSLKAAHDVFTARVFMRVQRMNIPAYDKIMRTFYRAVGVNDIGADASTFYTDMDGWIAKFGGTYRDLTRDWDHRRKTELMNIAMREEAISPFSPYRAELEALRALFAEMRKYMRDAGLPVGDVRNYFPAVFDLEALNDPNAAQEIYEQLIRDNVMNPIAGVGQQGRPYTLEEIVSLLEGMRDQSYTSPTDPAFNVPEIGNSAPWAQALAHRKLPDAVRNSIRAIANTEGKPKYMAKDMDHVISTYVRQSVMRAEYNRRLGDPTFVTDSANQPADTPIEEQREFDPHKRLKALLEEARVESGATDEQRAFMHDVVSAMMGQYQRIQSPAVRKLTNAMMLYQNTRTLLFTVFSSFPDIANIFLRGGDFGRTWKVIRENAGASWRGELNGVLRSYGHAADIADSMLMRDIVNERDNLKYVKWNESFFKATGLTKWANFTRGLAAKVAEDYILQHGNLAAEGNEDSIRRLAELGVTWEHVAEWQPGQTKFTTPLAGEGVIRVTAAMQQMINDMVIHPTPPEKTLWGSDERMKLVWHLKSFMYGFSTRVLGRAWHEIQLNGWTSPQAIHSILALSLLLPLAAFGLFMRDLAQYWVWGEESYTPYDNPVKYLWVLAGRSGITGMGQMAIDTAQASQKGRAPLLALAGPTITQLNDFLEYPLYKTIPGAIPIISNIPGLRNELRDILKPGSPAE